jgi:hypothetical protein
MEAWQLRAARIDAEMAEREREAEEWEEVQRLEAHARPPNADDFPEQSDPTPAADAKVSG